MTEYNLTLEERGVFERLVRDNANACIDLVKARENVTTQEGRVSATQHAINDYVNGRTALKAEAAYKRGATDRANALAANPPSVLEQVHTLPLEVPTGTLQTSACTAEEVRWGVAHVFGSWVPVNDCFCTTCNAYRMTQPVPVPPPSLDEVRASAEHWKVIEPSLNPLPGT